MAAPHVTALRKGGYAIVRGFLTGEQIRPER